MPQSEPFSVTFTRNMSATGMETMRVIFGLPIQ